VAVFSIILPSEKEITFCRIASPRNASGFAWLSVQNPAKRFFSEEEAQRNECAVPRAARQRI